METSGTPYITSQTPTQQPVQMKNKNRWGGRGWNGSAARKSLGMHKVLGFHSGCLSQHENAWGRMPFNLHSSSDSSLLPVQTLWKQQGLDQVHGFLSSVWKSQTEFLVPSFCLVYWVLRALVEWPSDKEFSLLSVCLCLFVSLPFKWIKITVQVKTDW